MFVSKSRGCYFIFSYNTKKKLETQKTTTTTTTITNYMTVLLLILLQPPSPHTHTCIIITKIIQYIFLFFTHTRKAAPRKAGRKEGRRKM